MQACEDKGRVLIIETMNDRLGDSEVDGVKGTFGASGMLKWKEIELCMEK